MGAARSSHLVPLRFRSLYGMDWPIAILQACHTSTAQGSALRASGRWIDHVFIASCGATMGRLVEETAMVNCQRAPVVNEATRFEQRIEDLEEYRRGGWVEDAQHVARALAGYQFEPGHRLALRRDAVLAWLRRAEAYEARFGKTSLLRRHNPKVMAEIVELNRDLVQMGYADCQIVLMGICAPSRFRDCWKCLTDYLLMMILQSHLASGLLVSMPDGRVFVKRAA